MNSRISLPNGRIPGNRKRIEMAEVQVPVEILQRGFFSGGHAGSRLGDPREHRDNLELSPECDAIVFVTSCTRSDRGEFGVLLRQCRSGSAPVVCCGEQDGLGA